jgi:hypothetical protein
MSYPPRDPYGYDSIVLNVGDSVTFTVLVPLQRESIFSRTKPGDMVAKTIKFKKGDGIPPEFLCQHMTTTEQRKSSHKKCTDTGCFKEVPESHCRDEKVYWERYPRAKRHIDNGEAKGFCVQRKEGGPRYFRVGPGGA